MEAPSDLYNKIIEATNYIKSRGIEKVEHALVTGTGLKDVVVNYDFELEIPFSDIPHFPVPSVDTHDGSFVIASRQGKQVIILLGRFHYYEGLGLKEVTFPIRVLQALGVRQILMTNITGSVNPDINPGDVVIVKDHINLLPQNPLRGINDKRLGPRFPVMIDAYDGPLAKKALSLMLKKNIKAHSGIYLCLQGPNLETGAEYRFFNTIGADVIGMSTVPEVIVARQAGMKVIVASLVSNQGFPKVNHSDHTLDDILTVVSGNISKLTYLADHIFI